MTFSEQLKKIRKEKKITQEGLAELLGVSRQAVSKWENGDGYPETEKLLRLSRELSVSLDELLGNQAGEPAAENVTPDNAVPAQKIAIMKADQSETVQCLGVRVDRYLGGKSGLNYVLHGIKGHNFWGEQTEVLGWYESEAAAQREVAAIHEAMREGRHGYTLQFAAKVDYKGIFQQPRIAEEES